MQDGRDVALLIGGAAAAPARSTIAASAMVKTGSNVERMAA
mgnify:CR=1 FL=1